MLAWFDRNRDLVPLTAPIIDLGCGNGVTCIHLASQGFSDVTGVDYSPDAIKLARKIAEKHGLQSHIEFEVCDILDDAVDAGTSPAHCRKFDVVFDKGTYDAISLDPEGARVLREKYIHNVSRMLNDESLLAITSCNWTKEEILRHFSKRKNEPQSRNVALVH